MTDLQLYLAIGIPAVIGLTNTALILFLYGRTDAQFGRVDSRFERMEARFDRIDADLRQFFQITGAHGEAIDILKKR